MRASRTTLRSRSGFLGASARRAARNASAGSLRPAEPDRSVRLAAGRRVSALVARGQFLRDEGYDLRLIVAAVPLFGEPHNVPVVHPIHICRGHVFRTQNPQFQRSGAGGQHGGFQGVDLIGHGGDVDRLECAGQPVPQFASSKARMPASSSHWSFVWLEYSKSSGTLFRFFVR